MAIPEPITDHDHWMRVDGLQWAKIRKEQPTANMRRLRQRLTAAMELKHGPCPPKPGDPPRPPWYIRLALKFLSKKLEKKLEAKMDGKASKVPKGVLALVAGVGAIGGILQLAMPDGISAGEWMAIGNAFIVAAWAKFSNPEKVVSPKPSVK